MKYISLPGLILLILPLNMLAQVSFNDALFDNSEVMKQKYTFSFSSDHVHKATFGPYKIIDVTKGRQHLTGKQYDTYFELEGGGLQRKRSQRKISTQPYSLSIIQDGGDTMISNMNITNIKNGDHALIESHSGNVKEQESDNSYCLNMAIQVKNDSLNWHLSQNSDQSVAYLDFPSLFDGVLTNGVDNILVKGAEDFPVKHQSRIFSNPTKGIVFISGKKQIAAVQMFPQPIVWFSNNINERYKQVIAAAIISWLSISNSPRM